MKTKADIILRGAHPALNVKVHGSPGSPQVLHDFEHDGSILPNTMPAFRTWLSTPPVGMLWDSAWEAATEKGWEQLQCDAEALFGTTTKVYSEGRSGGWCVVHNLPPPESWDAIMFTKWRTFAKWAAAHTAGVPFNMLWHLYHNHFLPQHEYHHRLALGMCE